LYGNGGYSTLTILRFPRHIAGHAAHLPETGRFSFFLIPLAHLHLYHSSLFRRLSIPKLASTAFRTPIGPAPAQLPTVSSLVFSRGGFFLVFFLLSPLFPCLFSFLRWPVEFATSVSTTETTSLDPSLLSRYCPPDGPFL